MMLRIIPVNNEGLIKLQRYVDSCTKPTIKDKLRMWKAKQINKLIYKGMVEPKMLREEWDDKMNILSIIVEDSYIQYGNELLENSKINFLKLVKDDGKNFNLEVIQ